MRKTLAGPVLAFVATGFLLAPEQAAGQRLIERTPNLPNSVDALPGFLEMTFPHRFIDAGGVVGLTTSTTFDLAVGMPFLLPVHWTGGVRFAPASTVVEDDTDEWELYDRFGLLRQAAGAPLDLTLTGAWNVTARSLDAEATVARRAGPFRVIGAARALGSAYAARDTRFALAAGAVWHVRPRHMGVTLAGDIATLTDRTGDEEPAWSVGVHAGLPYTSLSIGLQAGNAATTTLQGASVGDGRTRYGFELNAPVELLGFVLGWFASREVGARSVSDDVAAAPAARVDIRNFVFAPAVIRIRAGQTIEWVNDDAVVHTVNSENAAFQSGAIQPGSSWRARFDEPGRYPYYCGPHPFMKGVVVVTR